MERSVPKQERWIVLVAAVGFLTVAGAAYSWSLYTRPLMAFFGWSSVEVALGFSLLIVFIATGAIAGGFLHDWFGPRWVSVGGAVMWGMGSLLAGLGLNASGLWWLYLTYSAIGGFGCGMMYVVPGACVTKWFPEERGLANGIVLCGFGLGSLFFNLIVSAYAPFARIVDLANRIESGRAAAAAAGHPYVMIPGIAHAGIAVIAQVFLWSGVAFLILGVICALVLHPPPAGFSVAKMAGRPVERNVGPREMFRSRAFYLIWSMILINSTCGLALFGNGVAIYAHVAGVGGVAAVATFGWLSSANGFGRLLWAWLSDDVRADARVRDLLRGRGHRPRVDRALARRHRHEHRLRADDALVRRHLRDRAGRDGRLLRDALPRRGLLVHHLRRRARRLDRAAPRRIARGLDRVSDGVAQSSRNRPRRDGGRDADRRPPGQARCGHGRG